MDIREHSSKFLVYVFTPGLDAGPSVRVSLSKAGYEAYYFEDGKAFEQRLADSPPHVLVFNTAHMGGTLSEFVERVRQYNDGVKFVVIASHDNFSVLSQYNTYGLEEVLSDDPKALDDRAVWAVDRTCEKIYLTFQNEQLFDQWKDAQERAQKAEAMLPSAQAAEAGKKFSLFGKISEYKTAQSKEEVIQKFMEQIEAPAIYFKYLPSVGSFVATHSHAFDPNLIQGVGSYLKKEEMRELHSQMVIGQLPQSFAQMLKEAFQFDPAKSIPLYVHHHLEGVVVYSGQLKEAQIDQMTEEFSLFSMCYSHFCLEKKVDQLEVQDFVTGAYNRTHYQKALKIEFDRSRRMQQPLCVIKMSIDDFNDIETNMGEAVRDSLLKNISELITKTSRSHDITSRTQMNEFSLILPQCPRKGAAMRAERLRRIIESASLLDNGLKITVSIGVSEYPGMCNSAETLDESASKALLFVYGKGGNKICLFKAPNDHTPEFEVQAE